MIRSPSKYRAIPTFVDGIRFASKKEAARYKELKLLEKTGHIQFLTLQVRYPLDVNGIHICEYRADFRYWEHGWVVEDAKGKCTYDYTLKKKLMRAIYGITIKET